MMLKKVLSKIRREHSLHEHRWFRLGRNTAANYIAIIGSESLPESAHWRSRRRRQL